MIQALLALLLLAAGVFLFVRRNFTMALVERGGELVSVPRWKVRKLDVIWLAGIGILSLFVWGFRLVPPGLVAVRPDGAVVRGWFWTPWPTEGVLAYPVTRQVLLLPEKGEEGLWAPTRDGVSAGVRVALWYALDTGRIRDVATRWKPEDLTRALHTLVEGSVRDVLAGLSLRELAGASRESLATVIRDRISRVLGEEGIRVERVILQDVMIPVAFQKVFEQEALARSRLAQEDLELERARKAAERARVEAEGKARAIEIVSRALKQNPEYLRYLYIEKLSDKVDVIIQDSKGFLNFPDTDRKRSPGD